MPSVYLETTIISYLAARPSRDIRVAAHQEITASWWTDKRSEFNVFASQLVVQEALVGDARASQRRQEVLEGLPLLETTPEALALAARLVSAGAVPAQAAEDSLHIAIAAMNGMDYLLTWNCRHIANATLRARIAAVCEAEGVRAPVICTPEELETLHD